MRHGESTWNALGLVQGQMAEPALTLLGLEQARRAAAFLAGAPIGAIYSSDLRRAVQTAAALGTTLGLPVVEDARLRERCFGAAEGGPSAALLPATSGIEGERVVDADAAPPGGESVGDVYRRVAGFVEELTAAPCDGEASMAGVVLVVHGGVVRVLLAWLDGVEPDRMAWGPVGNGLVVSRPLAARRLPLLVT